MLAELTAADFRSIAVMPIFWSHGGHVAVDLPALVQEFAAREPGVSIRILPALSELPGMHHFVARAILAQSGSITAAQGEGPE
ncbi:Cobalamin (Vitamin B12) biosynthesis CbiX protein (fragment) [Burkholderiales bacterium]